jgi:hypothetical protein
MEEELYKVKTWMMKKHCQRLHLFMRARRRGTVNYHFKTVLGRRTLLNGCSGRTSSLP